MLSNLVFPSFGTCSLASAFMFAVVALCLQTVDCLHLVILQVVRLLPVGHWPDCPLPQNSEMLWRYVGGWLVWAPLLVAPRPPFEQVLAL